LRYIKKINTGETDDWIQPGDIVALLPMMYTGNTDMKDVPIGRLAGSYVNISAINNLLSDSWVKEFGKPLAAIIFFASLAALAGIYLGSALFFIAMIFLILLQIAIGLSSFSYAHTVFPWPFTA